MNRNYQNRERGRLIQQAIAIIKLSGGRVTVKTISRASGISPAILYKHPEVKPYIGFYSRPSNPISGEVVTNSNYRKLVDLGFELQVTTTRSNVAWLYLIKHRRRVHKFTFPSNGNRASILQRSLPVARYYTHVDQVMVTALEFLEDQHA